MGLAATEKHPTLTGMAIYRVTGDKCVERWVQVDFTGLGAAAWCKARTREGHMSDPNFLTGRGC
jgi:hypothetical protein